MGSLFILITLLAAQANARSVSSAQELKLRWKNQPRLTYCRTDSGVPGAIRVAGEIAFENAAKHPILLLRQRAEFHGFMMRPINPSLSVHTPYESYVTIVHAKPDFGYRKIDFVHLRPREQYTESWSAGVLYNVPGNDSTTPLVADGDYLLSFKVSIWHDSEEDAVRAAKALGKTPIWTPFLWSEPIRIEVRSATPTEVCR
jgi:hypothetical protein